MRRRGDLRPLPGDARRRRVRQARHQLARGALSPLDADRAALRGAQRRMAGGPPAVLPGTAAGRCRRRRAGREPGAPAGRAQARRGTRNPSSTRWCGCTSSRSSSPTCSEPTGDFKRLHEALARAVAAGRADLRPAQPAGAAEGAAPGRVEDHRRRPVGEPRSSPSGRASTTAPTASPSTSARPPSPHICATSRAARWSPRPG